RTPLLDFCKAQNLRGSILLASEGINGTVAGTKADIDAMLAHLRADARMSDLEAKFSQAQWRPFRRMKVRLKRYIVNMGIGIEADPNERVGTYVEPQDWNDLITQDDVVLIDTRNTHEFDAGTFKGAIDPQTASFVEFPQYVDEQLKPQGPRKVAMFCTGGIRCERATAYLLNQGFEEVYHLKGGILRYLEEIEPEVSLWEGDCFIFDERGALTHDLAPVDGPPEDEA
ncbi:MAG: rhodanese-related sulfurtransferase, partial [Chloroflexota bacterium]